MKKVLIVESPSKVKTISKFLSKDFLVTSTKGHIRDLPVKTIGIEIKKNSIDIEYENLKNKTEAIKGLIKATSDADIIYLAPDPDREGEIIALHTKEVINKKLKKDAQVYRITFNEISKKAVTEAIKNTRDIDPHLIEAQQSRRILDRLVGYKVSPVLWKKVSRGLSAGRVQSVALKIICIREREIRSFVIEEYWSVHAQFCIEKTVLLAELVKINNEKIDTISETEAKKISTDMQALSWHVESIKDTERSRKPYAPFITSTLQQASYNQLGFNVQQTMSIAQKMYEGIAIKSNTVALITYMRTDSTRISESALKEVRNFIEESYSSKYLPDSPVMYSKSSAATQDAHEAIRPIDVTLTPESIKKFVDAEIYKLYDLIWRRFVACQMVPAIYTNRLIMIESDKKQFTVKASGSIIKFDGFLKVYNMNEDEEEETKLPPLLKEKSKADLQKVDLKQHFTQPPARYSEATLVKELESEGIGRPSTYAAIMKTIRDRLYTMLDDKKRFVPTELGMKVSDILDENLPEIMDIQFTSKLEEQLDLVAEGKITRDKLIIDFYDNFTKSLEKFEKKKLSKSHEETTIKCPDCTNILMIKVGKTGEFLACSQYPNCKFTSNFKRNEHGEIIMEEQKKDEVLDLICPTCGKNLVKKNGRYGEFIACSGYPACKYIHKEQTKELCPGCKKDHLVKRKWKNSIFWSCASYPNCKFGISGDIIEQTCGKCQFPFLKKVHKNGIAYVCANNNASHKCDFEIQE